jgi:hypothetical protein
MLGALGALALAAAPVEAANKYAGTSAAQFLKLGAGSRAGAMAEAYSALADDAYALYYNPGAAARLSSVEIAGAHTEHFQGMSYEFLGLAVPLKGSQVMGLAVYNLSISGIERRTDDTAESLGSFGAGDYSYNLTYACRFGETLGAGVTGKLIHQTIDSYRSSAFGADLGVHYVPKPDADRPVSLAFVLRNAGTRPSFAGVSDPLPVGAVAGVAFPAVPGRLHFDLDVSKYRDTDIIVAVGAEARKSFTSELRGALRAGYSNSRPGLEGFNGVTLGVGLGYHRAGFDFAWVPFGILGDTFRYSLHLKF